MIPALIWKEPSAIEVARKPRCTAGPAATSLLGPTLPSTAFCRHGSYLGISCRPRRSCTTVEDDPFRKSGTRICCDAQPMERVASHGSVRWKTDPMEATRRWCLGQGGRFNLDTTCSEIRAE